MTYVAPYSQATLMYEPSEVEIPIEIATPGTLLEYVAKNSPKFLHFIKKANLLNLYNSTQCKNTLFLPLHFHIKPELLPQNQKLDPNIAFKICKFSTIPGMITTQMLLSSPNLVIYSLLSSENLNINSNSVTGEITVQNNLLVAGDILCTNGIIHIISNILYPDH